KIKGIRAVTARATFLCLCKETWRKEAHPACAPGAAHRVRGAGGIFRGGILPPRKTPHIPVRRPPGLVRRPAAPEGSRSPVGRVLTRRSFADIRIKSFRAVTARATFLCLCKETWRKESTPRLRARCSFDPSPACGGRCPGGGCGG